MALPKLPGYDFNTNLGKEKFHVAHHFQYINDVPVNLSDQKDGIGGDPHALQDINSKHSKLPRGEGTLMPAWIAFDKQVLCFTGYFSEDVTERREETSRVRYIKLYFYLEDDSMQIVEPKTKDSQLPQGTLIKRHRIPKPAPNQHKFFTIDDLNVGIDLCVYGREFRLTDCDEFTKNFMRRAGIRLNENLAPPNDTYNNHRQTLVESMSPLRPYEKSDTLRKFLEHDRQVLRFYAVWDDRKSKFGQLYRLEVHYFLADDTIEIKEVIPPNAGKDSVTMLLKRGPLPKEVIPLPKPGQVTQRTVLNVFGQGANTRYILDSLKTGAQPVPMYTDADLRIGTTLNVWGRPVLLLDCDEFTKNYYSTKFGVDDFTPVRYEEESVTIGGDSGAGDAGRQTPPYNGFGGEADSSANCKKMLPQPPKGNLVQFLEKDRCGIDSGVLRFVARLKTDKPIDKTRAFIIAYHLSDDTIEIFDPPVRNSGIMAGKFLERGRAAKPNRGICGKGGFGPAPKIEPTEAYTWRDLYVGAVVTVNNNHFEILDADEYAYNYMESRPDQFPVADLGRILGWVQKAASERDSMELTSALSVSDQRNTGFVRFHDLRDAIRQLGSSVKSMPMMPDHCIITLARYYGKPTEAAESETYCHEKHKTLYDLQWVLKRHQIDVHSLKMYERFVQDDVAKTGTLDYQTLSAAIKSFRLPFGFDYFERALKFVTQPGEGIFDYRELTNYMDWRRHPLPYSAVSANVNASERHWPQEEPSFAALNVDYRRMLDDLHLGGAGDGVAAQ